MVSYHSYKQTQPMQKKLLLVLALLMVTLYSAMAQTRTVTGRVTAATDGSGLPGVTVVVRGTTSGTSTDVNGQYSIALPDATNPTLVFSFVGMTTQEIPVGNRTTLNVALGADATQLEEVVVVGYGTQAKADITGSIARVTSREIENLPVTSVENALQGRAAGVYINSGSGKLGSAMQIRIRGASSVSASNQPLYVIDGIPVTTTDLGSASSEPINPMADINPNDIESIEILKDASAAAIYGSRASNGVILITTKKGKVGKSKVDLNYYTGVSSPTRLRDWMDRDEYIAYFTEAATRGAKYDYLNNPDGWTDEAEAIDYYLNEDFYPTMDFLNPDWRTDNTDTDWQDQALQNGSISQYSVSVNGGDEKTRFFISGSHLDQTGIIVGNEFQRSSGRINLDHSVSKKFKIGTNLSLIRTINTRVPDDNAFSNPLQLVALTPISPLYSDSMQTSYNRNTLYYNNLIELDNATNISTNYRTISNFFGSYEFIPGLTLRAQFGLDFFNLDEDIYRGRQTEDGGPTGYGYSNQVRSLNYTTNTTLAYNKTFNEIHNLDVLAGMEFQESDVRSTSSEAQGFPNDQFKKIASAAVITSGSTTGNDYTFLSYFSRANYNLRGKYLLSASARLDGSSRFGSDNRYGFFPSASAGWIVSEETFLSESNAVSFLKLRTSYGVTGNSEIGNFASRALYSAIPYANLAGIYFSSLPNPELSWETTRQVDVGIDFGFLNNRISGEIDYYVKKTEDLLINVPLPATSGFTTITKNVGNLENKGLEFVLNTANIQGAFTWNTTFNIARNRNKITKLNVAPILGGSRNLGRIAEGEPMGYYYGPKFAGVDPANGDALYYTEDGETTNDYSQAFSQKVGDPNPDFVGGLDNRFGFKGFDLSVLMQFVYGNDLYNTAGYFQAASGDYYDNQTTDQLRGWKNPGDITDVPEARLYGGNGTGNSSRWVEDGSFLRVKTVQLGYNIPSAVANRVKLQNARIYFAAQNLFTFTNYNGWDPEVNTTYNGLSNVNIGHDFYTPPQAKTITIGVTLSF